MLNTLKQKSKKTLEKVKNSKPFLAILMLAIGISYTVAWYEWQSLYPAVKNFFEPKQYVFVNDAFAKETEKEIASAPVAEAAKQPETTLDTIKRVASEENVDWKILMGICMEESRGCSHGEVGDGGDSIGWFQINKPWDRNVTVEEAHNLEFSARWTAKRLKQYAAKGGWDYAIRKHNGNADYNFGTWKASYARTEQYLARVKENIKTL